MAEGNVEQGDLDFGGKGQEEAEGMDGIGAAGRWDKQAVNGWRIVVAGRGGAVATGDGGSAGDGIKVLADEAVAVGKHQVYFGGLDKIMQPFFIIGIYDDEATYVGVVAGMGGGGFDGFAGADDLLFGGIGDNNGRY